MGKRSPAWFLLLTAALCLPSLAQQAQTERVTVVPTAAGFSLWLPGEATLRDQIAVLGVVNRFSKTWANLFGARPVLPDPLVVPAGPDLRKGAFASLWRQASAALEPAEQAGVQEALRYLVLDDPAPVLDPLAEAVQGGRVVQVPLASPLLYVFLRESVREPGFLPQALPPGPEGGRLAEALAAWGVPSESLRSRYAAWLLSKALEFRLIRRSQAQLPAVWVLDSDLAPGETAVWRFGLDEGEAGLDLECVGSASPGLRLLAIFTDEAGRPVHASVWEAGDGPAVLPRKGPDLWFFLWNAGDQDRGAGLTLTLWKEARPPFTALQATWSGATCEVLLDERAGVFDYEVVPVGDALPTDAVRLTFASVGEGLNRYHLRANSGLPSASEVRVSCRTLAGGTYSSVVPVTPPVQP
jgi:hypothetical protein